MSKVNIGDVVLLGALVDRPVADWGLVYGEIVTKTPLVGVPPTYTVKLDGTYTFVGFDLEPVTFSWEGKSIDQMDHLEYLEFNQVWNNPWIRVQYHLNGKWKTPLKRNREVHIRELRRDVPRRILREDPTKKELEAKKEQAMKHLDMALATQTGAKERLAVATAAVTAARLKLKKVTEALDAY
ncbi:hypothetical protein [Vibrio phage vB_VhaP_PG11]|nr:hypothetical protein [Vibrio phage vB_VhaP_PG11]